MQNKKNETNNEWSGSDASSVVDRAMSEVKKINPEDIKRTATELTSRVRDVSADYYDDAITYVRRNPVTSALGLCALGFVAGMLTGMGRRAA